MRTTFMLIPLLLGTSAVAGDRVSQHHSYAGNVAIGDPISKVQASLGKPHRTYEIQNAYGGVVEFDYIWDSGDAELTFVVGVDGTISDIWQAD